MPCETSSVACACLGATTAAEPGAGCEYGQRVVVPHVWARGSVRHSPRWGETAPWKLMRSLMKIVVSSGRLRGPGTQLSVPGPSDGSMNQMSSAKVGLDRNICFSSPEMVTFQPFCSRPIAFPCTCTHVPCTVIALRLSDRKATTGLLSLST